MKKKKYLALYYEWMKTGKLPNENGLCSEFSRPSSWDFEDHPLFPLFIPDGSDCWNYWAGARGIRFNPLRQNIVLLMAAMAGEL